MIYLDRNKVSRDSTKIVFGNYNDYPEVVRMPNGKKRHCVYAGIDENWNASSKIRRYKVTDDKDIVHYYLSDEPIVLPEDCSRMFAECNVEIADLGYADTFAVRV